MKAHNLRQTTLTPELFFAFFYILITFIVFCVIPIIATSLNMQGFIYPWGFEPFSLLINALSCALGIFFIRIFRNTGEPYNLLRKENKFLGEEILLIFTWMYLFFYFGGTTYRTSDLLGEDRNLALNLILVLSPFITILVIKFLFFSKRRLLTNSIALLVLFVLALSGGRGTHFQVGLAFIFFSIANPKKPLILKRLFHRKKFYFSGLKMIFFLMIVIIIFGVWGMLRDGYTNFYFSTIYRLSEPYWSLAESQNAGYCDVGMISDFLQRFTWSILRVDVFNIGGSIDGNTYYNGLLGISEQAGISLPITILGHGYLLCGSYGALFAFFISILMIFIGMKLCFKLASFLPKDWCLSFKIYFLSKVVFFHSKSLSGLSSYLYYETIRDWLIIVTFIFACEAYRSMLQALGSLK